MNPRYNRRSNFHLDDWRVPAMAEGDSIGSLITRVRAGDAQAAAELVRRYEPVIRSRIRIWLRMQDRRLRRVFDSMDVCQSVLASFFVRAAAGQYDLEQPEQVVGLLVRMAQHKLAHQVSKQQAQRRDVRRIGGADLHDVDVAAPGSSPSEIVAGQELLQEFRKRLSDEERRLADLKAQGSDWAAIAAELGGTADGRRMQLARALDRVASQLGLDPAPTR
jgi:RNA polymerase sigma-70 factor (ECF subfamily)